MLPLRLIAPNDYTVHEDRHPIGRIWIDDRSPGVSFAVRVSGHSDSP